MSDEVLLLDRDGGVATLTLNRPDQRNALNGALKDRLVAVLAEVATDTTVRAVVLTGAGPGFCVGQDLGEHAAALAQSPDAAFATVDQHYAPIVRNLALMPKPVIAAVNGTCVGAGLGFALACDLRVFAATASFGTAFTSIGLTCDSGLSASLVRSVGEARARELVLTGRTFGPVEADAWGIAGEVVAADEVLPTALGLAAKLADGPTLAFAESKALLAAALRPALDETLDAEEAAQLSCGRSQDHAGAVAAFLAKERPRFLGR